jgi:CRISPR/Cas system CMR subunit Cmr6 (Cas7 group RAMP superfamily)
MLDGPKAAGPLGSAISLAGVDRHGRDANALVMLDRLAFLDDGKLADEGKRALLRWACARQLGQADTLVTDVWRRRSAALRALPWPSVRLRARPEWRLVVGLGAKANAHEIGLALHGSYGWPVIPGSALKGLAHAWASSSAPEADVKRVFGTTSRRGGVCFLDAIPAGRPVAVEADVLTPHVKPYYDDAAAGRPYIRPPAEYHTPVPVQFLTVSGEFAVDLYGPDRDDVELAAGWLTEAGDGLGAGAKTAAGYGYLEIRPA